MKKSLKGILASVVAMLVFAPSVKAEVIELTQADFAKTDVPAKSIEYDRSAGAYNLEGEEYKFTEDIILPDEDYIYYFYDTDVTIDATGHTVKGIIEFWNCDVTILGGTFEGVASQPAIAFSNSNVVIKNGTFTGNNSNGVRFNNFEYIKGVNTLSSEFVNDKTLMIENGVFTSDNESALFVGGGKLITIKNGTFTGKKSGLELSNNLDVVIEKGKFKATFDESNQENSYKFVGAIGINNTIDTTKINKLLAENSVWSEEIELNVTNKELTNGNLQNVYTQKEISVVDMPKSNIDSDEEKKLEEESKSEESTKTADKKAYKTLDGEKQEYNLKSSDRLTFRFDIDYAEFVASGKVYVDDVLIDSSNYETKEGSTIVVFTKDYTDHLKVGNHTIKVVTDKGEATAEFTIKKSEKNPGTGDNAIKYIVLTILAVAAAVVVTVKRKKIFNY